MRPVLVQPHPPNRQEALSFVPQLWEPPPAQGAAFLPLCGLAPDPSAKAHALLGGTQRRPGRQMGWLWALRPILTLVITRSFLM